MSKKFWIGLLILTFVLGSVGSFWAKPTLANTGEELRVMLCVAEPWNNDFYQSGNPTPRDSSGLGTTGNLVKPQSVQQNTTSKRTDYRVGNLFHHILHTLWGMIFPESF